MRQVLAYGGTANLEMEFDDIAILKNMLFTHGLSFKFA